MAPIIFCPKILVFTENDNQVKVLHKKVHIEWT